MYVLYYQKWKLQLLVSFYELRCYPVTPTVPKQDREWAKQILAQQAPLEKHVFEWNYMSLSK